MDKIRRVNGARSSRRARTALAMVVVVAGLDTAAARAQGGDTERAGRSIEVGAGIGTVASWFESVRGGHVGMTVPLKDGLSLDGFVAIGRHDEKTVGLYAVQIKQRIAKASHRGFETFVTYGGTGYFERPREPGYRYTRSDGTLVVAPAYTDSYVTPPFIGVIGAGVQHMVAPRLAVRIDAQLMAVLVYPVGVRIAAGVSIPVGHVTRATHPAAWR